MVKINTCVFISGKGSNLKNLIIHSRDNSFPIKISLVISNNKKAYGINYAGFRYLNVCGASEDGIIGYSTLIRDQWDAIENDCHHWNNWFRYCKNHERFCNMTENALESAEDRWRALVTSQVNTKANLLNRLQEIREQIGYDHQQGIDQATLDQMIAETNNLISITAYNNESRELDVASRKSKELFAPIMIGIILLGMGFYLLKK